MLRENATACMVYTRCRSSWRHSEGLPAGISNMDINQAMAWMDIHHDDRLLIVDDVLLIIDTVKNEIACDLNEKRQKNKQRNGK